MKQDEHLNPLIFEPEFKATASIIWLHGLGADGYDFYGIPPQLTFTAASKTRFIFPHAPIRPITLNQGMEMRAWYDVVEIKRGSFEDEEGIQASEKILARLIEAEESKGISAKNIVLAGFSQGGVIAFQCGLRYPKPLGGILALSTYLPLAHRLPEQLNEANRNIPIFIGHGLSDDVIPITWARNSRQTLGQYGYSVEWHEYSMRHSVCGQEIKDIGEFLEGLGLSDK